MNASAKPASAVSRALAASDQSGVGADLHEVLGTRRDLAGRQAVDSLYLVVTLCDLEPLLGLGAVGIADDQRHGRRLVPPEAEQEAALLVDAQPAPGEAHLAARRDMAANQPALDEFALELQRVGVSGAAREQQSDQGEQPVHGHLQRKFRTLSMRCYGRAKRPCKRNRRLSADRPGPAIDLVRAMACD